MNIARNILKRRALSLLETTIAISVLGLGLIMLAAVFPVAMTRHRDAIDDSRATEMLSKAEMMIRSRIDPNLLWVDTASVNLGIDSPFYFIPFANISTAGAAQTWDNTLAAATYADLINKSGVAGGPIAPLQVFATDVLSDRLPPINDEEANLVQFRYIWYGFYRRQGNGTFRFAAAVCRQRQNETFYEQDFSVARPTLNPTPFLSTPRRFPVPWRVTVAREAGSQFLYLPNSSPTAGTIPLSKLAPRGSKIMISGAEGTLTPSTVPLPPMPAGRMLSVMRTLDRDNDSNGIEETLEVLEDISDIPQNDSTSASDGEFVFDIWLFPPRAQGDSVAGNTPMVEWKVSM